ncbi:sterol C-14 reductase [Thelephora ganbajun]|uniref:Sterol C-14 reductase n=1 Tax=Thelephora ganbajun TaxID=370292 RepID=A0ACB6ZJI3_THEGA|nr:sterol C-14 reductase [Thelephora ganbajun]
MDVTTDGIRYALSVRDLLWVSFPYTTGALYLAFEHYILDPVGTEFALLVTVSGYWTFRLANGEKKTFRTVVIPKARAV